MLSTGFMHRERNVPENRPLELSTRRSRWLGEIAVVVRYHSDPCRYSFYYKTQAGRQAGGLVIITGYLTNNNNNNNKAAVASSFRQKRRKRKGGGG